MSPKFVRLTRDNVYDYIGAVVFYSTSRSTAYGIGTDVIDNGEIVQLSFAISNKKVDLTKRRVNILPILPIDIEPGEK